MKQIALTQSHFAIVDSQDFEYLSQWKWCAQTKKSGKVYAAAWVGGKMVLMHRFILGITDFKVKVDHRNGNSLDNRRRNLRQSSNSENMMNRGAASHNKTGYKGVLKCAGRNSKPFKAQIGYNSSTIYLGYFETAREAALAYNVKAVELHGEFALLNEID